MSCIEHNGKPRLHVRRFVRQFRKSPLTIDSARDGKNLSPRDLVRGLKACYNLSTPLACFLVLGGFLLLRKMRRVDLHEIGEHGRIEHNASLVHEDTPTGQRYAPIEINERLVSSLLDDTRMAKGQESGDKPILMDATDVARARVRREKQCPKLGILHAEIARGEMGIILGVLETRAGNNVGVPVEWMREWIGNERLPKGWEPTHVQGFLDVACRANAIRNAMNSFRKAEVK